MVKPHRIIPELIERREQVNARKRDRRLKKLQKKQQRKHTGQI